MDEASAVQFADRLDDGPEHMDDEQEVLLGVLPGLAGREGSEDLLQIPRVVVHDHNPVFLIIPDFLPK